MIRMQHVTGGLSVAIGMWLIYSSVSTEHVWMALIGIVLFAIGASAIENEK